DELIDVYKEIYKNDFFVRIRDKGDHPTTKDVSGSNFCDIGLTYDERTNRVTVVSVIDNLVKGDRKSTRLNSSHVSISYAVFCLKKKKRNKNNRSQHTKRSPRGNQTRETRDDAKSGR